MKYLLILPCLFLSYFVVAQGTLTNEFILQLVDKKYQREVAQDLKNQGLTIKKNKLIYPSLNIYHLVLEGASPTQIIGRDQIKLHSAISHINQNHLLTNRAEPDDPFYSDQWNIDRIRAQGAWDLTTGGLNYQGDEIVVAVIDNGFDIMHEDLVDNIWVNPAETPGDGIDNDGNGYIDDINGTNVATGNGTYNILPHGTKVCGVLGAKGNNDQGITGINWDIKMMLISGQGDPFSEASVIEAYSYARSARKKYNDSDGAEGAFVVATNSSWGLEYQWAENYPSWCEIYDDLGSIGILSVAATSNFSIDISQQGDMPGTCSSEYLMIVTNTDESNTVQGGLSLEHVDIAAPGTGIFTTVPGSEYGDFAGTSAACPQVSGAVALIYAMPCNFIIQEIQTNPAKAALTIKSIILEQAFPISDMDQHSTSGGMLDLQASLESLNLAQTRSSGGFSLCGFKPNPSRTETQLEYYFPYGQDHTLSIYDYNGKLISSKEIDGADRSSNQEILDLHNYPSGLYFARLQDDKSESSFKFTKI